MKMKNVLLASALLASLMLTACSNDDMALDTDGKVAKSIKGVPSGLNIPESKYHNLVLGNEQFKSTQALFDSKKYKQSNMNSLSTFLYRDLISSTYSKDLDKAKLAKQLKHDLPNLSDDFIENLDSYKEYLKYKELSILFLKDFYKKELSISEFNKFTVLMFSYDSSIKDSSAVEDFEGDMSVKQLKEKYPSAYTTEINLDTFPDYLALETLNSRNAKVGDSVAFSKSSLSSNPSRMKEFENMRFVTKVISKEKIVLDNANLDKYVLFLNSYQFGDSEQKFFHYIKFLDDKLDNVIIPKSFYIQLARESVTYSDYLFYDLASGSPVFSQKIHDLNMK